MESVFLPVELILVIATVLINVILGLFTFFKNPNSPTHKLFAFLTFQIAFWAIPNYFSLHSSTSGETLIWIRTVMFDASFMGPTIFLFLATFPKNKTNIRLPHQVFIWLFAVCTAVLAITPYMFTSVSIVNHNVQPTPGPAIIVFALNFIGFLIAGLITIVLKFVRSQGIEKLQIAFLLYGIGITFTLVALANFILVVVFHQSSFVAYGPSFSLILVGFTFYAIIRHRLLDIRPFVARSVAYALVLLLLGGVFAFYLLFIGSLLFTIPFSIREFAFYGAIVLIASFAFQPLRSFLEVFSDRIFYKGYYNAQELLQSLSNVMSSTIDLDMLIDKILEEVLQDMRISRGVFVLLQSKDHGTIHYVKGQGYDKSLPNFTPETISQCLEKKRVIFFDDLEEGSMKSVMRNLNVSVVLPLFVEKDRIGIVAFGEKASGDIYSQEDVNVFQILTPQLAVAIENAKEYEEIKRFNITLREEIDKATKDLQNANERLKSLDKLKDEFVSLASHELRTPMTAIKSYSWMLREERPGTLNEKQKEYANIIYVSTERLIHLVNDMLNVSRIEAGRLTIHPKPVDLAQLAQEVLTEVLPSAQNQQIDIVLQTPSSPLETVFADADKTKEVFINLIGNSLKFTPPGGKITISFEQKDDLVITHVTDTGKGIKAEDMPKLFHKFGMIEGNYTRTSGQGTGLGLYISKSIVELQGGTMSVVSEGENKGTTFTFSLRKAQTITTAERKQPEASASSANMPAPFPEHPQA